MRRIPLRQRVAEAIDPEAWKGLSTRPSLRHRLFRRYYLLRMHDSLRRADTVITLVNLYQGTGDEPFTQRD